jgi:2-oxo-hept-3-ene-1,7-dioate hydratase
MSDARVLAGLGRLLETRRTTLAAGHSHLGWKMAFGAPAMMTRLELAAPAPGYLTDRTLLDNGGVVDTSTWTGPVAEFEIALHLGADVDPTMTPAEARATVESFGAAIELADIDIPLEPDRVEDIVAGNIFHRAVILGPAGSGPDLDLEHVTAIVHTDGSETHRVDDLEALTGEYGWVLVSAAQALDAHGEHLRAGDVVIGGSVVVPVRVESPATFTYELGSLPPLSVTVT